MIDKAGLKVMAQDAMASFNEAALKQIQENPMWPDAKWTSSWLHCVYRAARVSLLRYGQC